MSSTATRTNTQIGGMRAATLKAREKVRDHRPDVKPTDLLWLVAIAIIPFVLQFLPNTRPAAVEPWTLSPNISVILPSWSLTLVDSLLAIAVYASLIQNRDRTAAIVASALCATSIAFLQYVHRSPAMAWFTLLLIIGYAFYNYDWPIPLAIVMAAARVVTPDAIIFAVPFLVSSIMNSVRHSKLAAGLFFSFVCTYPFFGHAVLSRVSQTHFLNNSELGLGALTITATNLVPFQTVWWFLFPFVGELSNSNARRKYVPVVVAVILYLAAAYAFVNIRLFNDSLPVTLFVFIMVGVGVARVIPVIAGEVRGVLLRYILALTAVMSLIVVSFCQQLQLIQRNKEMTPSPVIVPIIQVSSPVKAQATETGFQQSVAANAAISQVKQQGEDSNESRSNGGRGRNTATAAHIEPTKTASAHPQQTVHATLDRAPQAVWSGGNHRHPLLSRG
jgi:hypothetical protein